MAIVMHTFVRGAVSVMLLDPKPQTQGRKIAIPKNICRSWAGATL
jgi:hypothetical protein